jgi:alkanesulfonate monooxygenase SsuD/methylene tetrahydromethanopterin reductase-like flavin-dependent oxidoreductase (luciferase family)
MRFGTFFFYGLAVDPSTLASAAASRTRRVRIGPRFKE